MSGHSKWSTIKRKKGAADARRGKLFSKLAKQITVAARLGKNLEMAVEAARAANMPKENIDRAIQRGTGEGLEGVQIEEVLYEAYGPGGAALLITALTDNRNRTIGELRALASKHGLRLAQSGSVQYLFEQRGILRVDPGGDRERAQLTLIDAGVADIDDLGDQLLAYTVPNELIATKANVEDGGLAVEEATIAFLPKVTVAVSPDDQEKLVRALEAIEELDDVQSVETNADFEFDGL